MAKSSLLGGDSVPPPAIGNDTNALGPSDNSDSGSDAQGAYGEGELASDSDAVGTGERATVGDGLDKPDLDILPDHIEDVQGILADETPGDLAAGIDGLATDEDDDIESGDAVAMGD